MSVHNKQFVCSSAAVCDFVWALVTFSKLPEDDQDRSKNVAVTTICVYKKIYSSAFVGLTVCIHDNTVNS